MTAQRHKGLLSAPSVGSSGLKQTPQHRSATSLRAGSADPSWHALWHGSFYHVPRAASASRSSATSLQQASPCQRSQGRVTNALLASCTTLWGGQQGVSAARAREHMHADVMLTPCRRTA